MDQALRQVFPYLLFPLANVLTCSSLVYLMGRTGETRKGFRLLAAAAFAVILWSLGELSSSVFPDPDVLRVLSFASSFIFFLLPLMLHLACAFRGQGGPGVVVRAAYVFAGVLTAVSWVVHHPSVDLMNSAAALAGAGYLIMSSRSAVPRAVGESAWTPQAVLVAGAVLILLLLGLDPLLKGLFSPLSLSFIPVILISWGLGEKADNGGKGAAGKQDLFHAHVVSLAMVPLLCELVFLALNVRHLFGGSLSSWAFHRSAVIVLCLFASGACAVFGIRKGEKSTESLLFSTACLFVCAACLRDLIVTSLPESLTGTILLVCDLFLVNAIGICTHLALRLTRNGAAWKVFLAYVPGLLVVAVMICEACLGRSLMPSGLPVQASLGRALFAAFFGGALLLCGFLIAGEARREKEALRRKGIFFVLAGFGALFALLAGLAAAPSLAWYEFAFIPLLSVGCGVFARDLRRVNAYARRQALSGLFRLLLVTVYLTLGIFIVWLLKDSTPQYVMDRLVPDGIPAALSFLVAASLSLFVLGMEKNRPEVLLFSVISFCYALLNLDISLLMVVQSPQTALFISRTDHFFLSLLLLGVNLHLAYLVIGKKDSWWVVYASYLVGLLMAPLSGTDWYFQGVYSYSWGFFARKAFLFDVMSALWCLGIAYAVYLLHRASRVAEPGRRGTVRRVLTAFLLLAFLSMSNTLPVYGIEVYPLGTFIFLALFYLAYGLFRFNLKTALQDIRRVLFGAGLAAIAVFIGFAPVYLLPGAGMNARVLIGLALVSALYHPAGKAWNAVLGLFIREFSDAMKDSYYRLTDNLSRPHHREKIHQMLSEWFFTVLECSSFVSLFSLNDLSGQRIYCGWKTWNNRCEAGLFGEIGRTSRETASLSLRKDHPLVEICRAEQNICTRDAVTRLSPSMQAFDGNEGLVREAEIVMPVFSKGEMLAVMLVGKKADGSPYSRTEFETMHDISLVLGAQIENAVLLEGLEEKVIRRTRELNTALSESQEKAREIRENNDTITRQNQIFRTLLETSTRIHQMESIDDLFSFILEQLHTLFTDFQGGLILENKRRGIIEGTSFIGISEEEQRVILSMRAEIAAPDFGETLNGAFVREGMPESSRGAWSVIPMEAPSSKISGSMILRGQAIDRQTREIFTVFLGQLSAVTQNRILMTQLERMASTDGMTGLYNRAFLSQEMRKVIQHAKKFKNIFFAIMVVDVDGLKRLNDTYGHEKGDEAIVKVAVLLKAQCRNTDIVSRLGGDEFAILMPSTNHAQAEILFNRIVEAAESLRVAVSENSGRAATLPVHISVGLASSCDTPPDDVMKKADTLMYEAKEMYYADKAMSRGC